MILDRKHIIKAIISGKVRCLWRHYIHGCYDIIEIGSIGERNNIINEVYGNISENILSDNILDSVILAPKVIIVL